MSVSSVDLGSMRLECDYCNQGALIIYTVSVFVSLRDHAVERRKQSAANNEFLDYLGEAYSCFLEGDDDAYNALNAEFASAHEAAHARSEERTKELQESMKSLGNQIHEVSHKSFSEYSSPCSLGATWLIK